MQQRKPVPSEPDFAAIKHKQQVSWSSGNYALVGTTIQIVGESLCEAANICAGEKVLDVCAGNGNSSLAAARRNAEVTATDFVPELLARAGKRAAVDGLSITIQTADAEALPFADGSFDAALSSYGIMFTPDHAGAAREIARVVRKGGRICLASWTPDGFIGQLFRIIGRFVAPAADLRSPALWGTEAHLAELFPGLHSVSTRRIYKFRYRTPAHWLDFFRSYYGPLNRAFAALDDTKKLALEDEILSLIEREAEAGNPSLVLPSTYLETVITK